MILLIQILSSQIPNYDITNPEFVQSVPNYDIIKSPKQSLKFGRLIVFAPFLLLIIKSPKQSLGDLLFLLRFFLLSLPNKVWGTYCFCSVSY
jgi:hypothetical protein